MQCTMEINGLRIEAHYSDRAIRDIFLPMLRGFSRMQKAVGRRLIVMLAAPPATGKSTLFQMLTKMSETEPDLTPIIIEINNFEEEGDRIYREGMHSLFVNETDMKVVLAKKEIYACLETVMDDIEDLANTVESVMMKNS